MKTLKLLFLLLLIFPIYCNAQENRQKSIFEKDFSKHEIGISWGAFPTSGVLIGVDFWMPASTMVNGRYSILGGFTYPWFLHCDNYQWEGPYIVDEENGVSYRENEFYKMLHVGAFTFNYQYHFNKKHSLGVTTSWLGRYISNYTTKPDTDEIINSNGWDNTFSICLNYRFTYYSKGIISMYTSIYFGVAIKQIEKKLLFASEKGTYWITALQITGFGIEAGKKHAFIAELGFGCQGLVKIGYRYKFKNN